jgi:hypothetical protein
MAISNAGYNSVGQAHRLRAQRPLETVSRVVGTHAPQTLSARALAQDVKVGVVSSVPFEALFASQEYRRGDISAKEYVAKALGNSVNFASWTVGGAVAGALLAPVGLPALAVGIAGFATGMVASEVWNRTVGKHVTKAIETAVPEALAEPVADVFTKAIANPLYDVIWKPLTKTVGPVFGWAMKNKVAAGAALGGLALAFPNAARVVAPEIITMAAGTAAGMAFTGKVIDPILPPSEEHSAVARPKQAPKAGGQGQAAGIHFARARQD